VTGLSENGEAVSTQYSAVFKSGQ